MTSGPTDSRLPKESESQRIGQEAVQAFDANHPANWRPTPLDGDSDFGLDQMIQVVDTNGKVSGGVFFVQIKGSESLDFSQDRESISIQLKINTLNYYCRIADPVMLVAVDRSSAEYPKDCRAYWTWISEQIRTALDGASDFNEFDQESLTIKIPASNVLTPDFDILPALTEFRRRKDAMESLFHAIDLNKGDNRSTLDAVNEVTAKVEATLNRVLTTFSESFDSPWDNPRQDSVRGKLHKVHTLLINNNDEDARSLLDDLNGTIPAAQALENAEYHYQNGRVLALASNAQRALEEYEKAYQLVPSSDKYAAAVFESRFQELSPEDDESEEIKRLLGDFPASGGDRLMALKARLHGAIGDYESADQILSTIDPIEAAVPRALNAYLQKDWSKTIAICQSSLASEVPRLGTKATLTMVLSRAHFYDAMAECEMPESEIIPPFGLPGTDLQKFEKAWVTALDAIALFRQQKLAAECRAHRRHHWLSCSGTEQAGRSHYRSTCFFASQTQAPRTS